MKETQCQDLPVSCPLCGDRIGITRIKCDGCGSEISGCFRQSGFGLLPVEYQKFIVVFLRHRGNIKAVEKELGISYPTINKMLEAANQVLAAGVKETPLNRKEILDAIDKGEISVRDATFILKSRKE